MKYANINVLSAVDDASQNGGAVDASQIISASFSARFGDATAAGTVKIQASNDPCPQGYIPATFTPTHWVDVPNATAAITAGSAALITIAQMSYRWVRVVYTRSGGGSTTINVDMFAVCV